MADKLTREIKLLNKYGMHVRPAGLFAKTASRFDATIEVEKTAMSFPASRSWR